MNVIIAGAGEVGGHAAEVLTEGGHNVTVIDTSPERLRQLNDRLDVRGMVGNCAHYDVLCEAGAANCGLMLAATAIDELNMLSAALAKAAGAAKTIVRAHHTANFKLQGTPQAARLGIDQIFCPEHMTSLAIARTLRNPGAIAIEEFGKGQVAIQRVKVQAGMSAVGHKLADLELPPSVRIATIEREGGAFIADANSAISQGDVVTLFGHTKRFESAKRLFNKGKVKHQNIVIMGDTSTAVWLCRALKSRIFSVRLFVSQHKRAEETSAKLDRVTVLEADPTDPVIFAEEKIDAADVFIAATADDERNILACAQAKTKGVKTSIAVVQRSTYMHLMPHVGIDHAFSPRSVAVRAMLKLIEDDPIRSLATFAEEIAEVYEIRPTTGATALGVALRKIRLPPYTMVASIHRGDDVRVPGADDTILANDTVLVIGPRGIDSDLRKLFVAK
jgi:trk system potassium uptake protein TrkA